MQRLSEKGYADEQLGEIKRMIDAEKSDLFDVLAYIAFALSPITREERVNTHRQQIFSHYDSKLQAFLDFVLSLSMSKKASASWIKPNCRTCWS